VNTTPATTAYGPLIAVLKSYRKLLFEPMPDGVIAKALDAKRTSLIGGGRPTIVLEKRMKEIEDVNRLLDTPLPRANGPWSAAIARRGTSRPASSPPRRRSRTSRTSRTAAPPKI
jgi:hypothetical protein